MSGEIRLPRQRKIASPGLLVLALVALFVTLARPMCDAHRWPGGVPQSGPVIAAVQAIGEPAGHEHSGTCCASMQEGTLALPATALADAFKSPPAAIVATVSPSGWRVALASLASPIPPDHPRSLKPYYARSARILI